MSDKQYKVRASHCDHQASDEEIYQVLKRTTEPLERSWETLAKARRIVLKFNMIKPPERVEYFAGRRRELVDDAVARAVLRLLRERTTAELVAVDACGMTLMGHDPQSDWPTPPFRRDRNHLLIAAARGFGTVDLDEIDFVSEVEGPLAEFDSVSTDSDATVANWRRTTCEQGLIYQDQQDQLIGRYGGQFIYLQDGQVVWNGVDPSNLGSRRDLSGDKKDSALWLKYVDPEEEEGERFERYSECLRLAS